MTTALRRLARELLESPTTLSPPVPKSSDGRNRWAGYRGPDMERPRMDPAWWRWAVVRAAYDWADSEEVRSAWGR